MADVLKWRVAEKHGWRVKDTRKNTMIQYLEYRISKWCFERNSNQMGLSFKKREIGDTKTLRYGPRRREGDAGTPLTAPKKSDPFLEKMGIRNEYNCKMTFEKKNYVH